MLSAGYLSHPRPRLGSGDKVVIYHSEPEVIWWCSKSVLPSLTMVDHDRTCAHVQTRNISSNHAAERAWITNPCKFLATREGQTQLSAARVGCIQFITCIHLHAVCTRTHTHIHIHAGTHTPHPRRSRTVWLRAQTHTHSHRHTSRLRGFAASRLS